MKRVQRLFSKMHEHFLSLSTVLNVLLFTDNSLLWFSFTLISQFPL